MTFTKRLLISLTLLVPLLVAVFSYAVYFRFSLRPHVTEVSDDCRTYETPCERIFFSTDDGIRISALLVGSPEAERHALFVSGYGLNSTDDHAELRAKALVDAGYSVMLLDHRNHGRSDRAITTGGALEQLDVLAALATHVERFQQPPDLVWCLSMGCTSSLYGLLQYQERHADVALPAYILESPMEEIRFSMARYFWRKHHVLWIPIGWLAMKFVELRAGTSMSGLDLRGDIPRLKQQECLVLFAGRDRFFSADYAEGIAKSADPRCTFQSVTEATHGEVFEALRNLERLAVPLMAGERRVPSPDLQ